MRKLLIAPSLRGATVNLRLAMPTGSLIRPMLMAESGRYVSLIRSIHVHTMYTSTFNNTEGVLHVLYKYNNISNLKIYFDHSRFELGAFKLLSTKSMSQRQIRKKLKFPNLSKRTVQT